MKKLILIMVLPLLFSACNKHDLPLSWEDGKEHIFGEMEDSYGNNYATVQLDSLVWMRSNMRALNQTDSESCDNQISNTECELSGTLYSQDEANSVCIFPWRLPSKSDFELLTNYAGKKKKAKCEQEGNCDVVAGDVLKNKETWGRFSGDNLIRLNMDPEGYQDINLERFQDGEYAYFWSSSDLSKSRFSSTQASAYSFYVTKTEGVFLKENFKSVKMSVRCVKSIEE